MSVADEIKSRLDIVDYIQRTVPLKRAGRTWKAPCPFHSEKTPSFVVDPDRQSWKCFGACATGGDVISFAMKQNGWSFSDALQELGKLTGVEVRQRTPEQREKEDQLDKLRGLMQVAADAYHNLLLNTQDAEAVNVLRYASEKRGLSEETIRNFGIGFAPRGWHNMLEHLRELDYSEDEIVEVGLAKRNEKGDVYDTFRNRLMIPIRDERGRVTGFGARALDQDDNPKYLNSPQTVLFDKSRTLFGLDAARRAITDSETAVIVEGYMDAIQAHQAGFTNVVAQMGTAMTEPQLKLIAPRWAKKIVLALDSDAAGQNATMRSLEVARQTLQADYSGRLSVDIRVLHIPDAKDPDDLIRETPEQWAALVEHAQPVADFVIEVEIAQLPHDVSIQQVEALARRLTPILVSSENQAYTRENIQKLLVKLNRFKYERRLSGLNITEKILLDWADEQARLRKPSPRDTALKVLKADLVEPPDVPQRDYDEADIPPEYPHPLSPSPSHGERGQMPARRPIPTRDVAIEEYCLRGLFRRPEAFYAVNRKLRQLAGSNRALLEGPLGDWSAEDFSHTDYRNLMNLFRAALDQDEMELFNFVQTQADESLIPHLDAILAEDIDGVRTRLHNGLKADLGVIWTHGQRVIASMDVAGELLEKALKLRINRLQRERETLCFLQIDAQENGDSAAEEQFQGQIILSSIAKGLIEAELQKQMSVLRE